LASETAKKYMDKGHADFDMTAGLWNSQGRRLQRDHQVERQLRLSQPISRRSRNDTTLSKPMYPRAKANEELPKRIRRFYERSM